MVLSSAAGVTVEMGFCSSIFSASFGNLLMLLTLSLILLPEHPIRLKKSNPAISNNKDFFI
jgi:hypothetical protein